MPEEKFHNVLSWGEEETKLASIQKKFLKYYPAGGTVLDIGSGRGVFLELLRGGGFTPVGVEYDDLMYKTSSARGFRVHKGNAISYLESTKESFDGIMASHIIEHLAIDEGIKFIELIKQRLKKGGVAIIITPRPGSLWAAENFWLDTTHIRPYPFQLMKNLFEPLEFVDGGIEPDSVPLKDAAPLQKVIMAIRRKLIGSELFDYVYGGGVSFIVARKTTTDA